VFLRCRVTALCLAEGYVGHEDVYARTHGPQLLHGPDLSPHSAYLHASASMRLLLAWRCVLQGCLFHAVASELQGVDALQAPTRHCGATVQVIDTHQRDSEAQGEGLGWVGSLRQPQPQ
jgi:hypothetical protein